MIAVQNRNEKKMATKKQILELLAKVKSGNLKIDNVMETLSKTRGISFDAENIAVSKGMLETKAYFVQNGKLVSLPLNKIRNDGRKAEFVPYYRTVNK